MTLREFIKFTVAGRVVMVPFRFNVIALPHRRKKIVPLFPKLPQQNDYAVRWIEQSSSQPHALAASRNRLVNFPPGKKDFDHRIKF